MRTDAEHLMDSDAGEASTSLAGHLLTAERVVMALVLLGFGVSGVLNLVPDASMPAGAAAVGGALLQIGFAYPLLKGTEVLLELYIGRTKRRQRARAELRRGSVSPPRSPLLRLCVGEGHSERGALAYAAYPARARAARRVRGVVRR